MTETTLETIESKPRKAMALGIAGLVIALFALVAAVLSPWIVAALEPESKPIDEVAVDYAFRIKDRMAAKMKGEEYVPPKEINNGFDWNKWYPMGTVSGGVVAMCLGIVGFVRREHFRLNGAAVTVGFSAIIFQYFLILAAALIVCLLIGFVLSALGIGLP